MPLTIRAATADDREFLCAMAARLADFDAPPSWRPAEMIAAGDRRDLLSALEAPPSASALMVADLDGRRAGCLHVITKIDFFTQLPYGHVSVIAVDKAAEGRGVGRALMGWAERWAQALGYSYLSLHVFPANTRARGLYEREGYAVDMLTMRKGIS